MAVETASSRPMIGLDEKVVKGRGVGRLWIVAVAILLLLALPQAAGAKGQAVTATAHSDATAWRGFAADSALILVDQLDLTEADSPRLTFWQKFTLAEGSVGQVMVSPDGGLTWEAVLTITTPVSDWTPVEVDLSAYAGQEIGLAFYLDKVVSGTQGAGAAVLHTPRTGARYADWPAGKGQPGGVAGSSWHENRPSSASESTGAWGDRPEAQGNSGVLALALPLLAAPALAVVWRRRKSPHYRWGWVILAVALIGSLGCGVRLNLVTPNPHPGENRIDDVLGEIEPVVLAEREPMAASPVSPDGKWMLVLFRSRGPVSVIDLEHNLEYEVLPDKGSGGLWLNGNYAVLTGGRIVHVPSLETWRLKSFHTDPDSLNGLVGAAHIYALEDFVGSGSVLVTTDRELPYWVHVGWNGAELEEHLAGIPHTIIQAGGLPFDTNTQRYYSPDGRYYITNRPFADPDGGGGRQEAMFDARTEKEVAHAYKYYWATYFLGWAYDSSGAYFMFKPRGVDADVLHPRHPIYKLLAPGAEKRGTPMPVGTPTPSSGGEATPGAEAARASDAAPALPVSYRPTPPAQGDAEAGWYVDDVVVQEAVPPPAADFVGEPLAGTAPLTVAFTDRSTGTISGHLWAFGDGLTSTLPGPTHVYEAAGVYTVALTVSGPGGEDREVKPDYVQVQPRPTPTPTPKPCPVRASLESDVRGLAAYRALRDEVLVRSAAGRRYAALYETHAAEVTRLLAADPELAAGAVSLLRRWQPVVEGLTAMERGEQGDQAAAARRPVTEEDVKEVRAWLEALAARGSPALRADVEGVLKEMEGFVGRTPAEIWEGMKQ